MQNGCTGAKADDSQAVSYGHHTQQQIQHTDSYYILPLEPRQRKHFFKISGLVPHVLKRVEMFQLFNHSKMSYSIIMKWLNQRKETSIFVPGTGIKCEISTKSLTNTRNSHN